MIEIKEMYEVDDSFNIIGYYSEDHVNKEEFLEIVGDHIKEDVEEGTIDWDWEDGDDILPKLEQVKYVWYKKVSLGEVDDCYDEEEDDGYCFVFSNKAKEGYSRMTRCYL